MMGMVGAIAVLAWFFYTAQKVGKNPALWAIIGALVYAATRWIWTLYVVRPFMGRGFYSHSGTVGFFIEISAIAVAVGVVVLIKMVFLRKGE
ncbi:MAG: hypothetical protein ACU843_08480 [Gammaproteobacteria bacterium]